MVTQHTRNRLSMYSAKATGLGLKVGVPIATVAAVYLLYVVFGDTTRHMDKMSPADRQYLVVSVHNTGLVLEWASVAIVLSLIVRFFFTESVGLPMTLGGALIYFGVGVLFGKSAGSLPADAQAIAAQAAAGLCRAGMIFLAPGVWLALRDGIIYIWRGVSATRVVERRIAGAAVKRTGRSLKPLTPCWESGYCRDIIRDGCPAFLKKKSCWRLKMGCLCDERILLKAAAGKGLDNDSYRGIMKSLGLDKPIVSSVSSRIKRARCRRCNIYLDHQKQKYRLLAPLVFPLVGFAVYRGYDTMSALVSLGVEKTDRFFSFMAISTTAAASTPESTVRIMTAMVAIWVSVLAVCYGLRALEYLMFDLQV